MPRGTVKWFHNSKGYGFIEQPDGDDLFVHYTAIRTEGYNTLKEGQEVEFEVREDDNERGPRAANVVCL